MAMQTVVGSYGDNATARRVIEQLTAAGIDRNEIHLVSADGTSESGDGGNVHGHEHTGDWGDRISDFFRSIFGGGNSDDQGYYAEAVRRGNAVVTVDARSDDEVHRVTDIMSREGALDVHEQAEEWKQSGWTGFDRSAMPLSAGAGARDDSLGGDMRSSGTFDQDRRDERLSSAQQTDTEAGAARRDDLREDETLSSDRRTDRRTDANEEKVIPVVKEELHVGKRTTQRGGVRVYSRVVETPVQESVHLHEEHADVQRRPADRPLSDADSAAFKEVDIEVRETAEQPVVAKEARVVEEVVVGKTSSDRTQTVEDTVRGTQVEVEDLGAGNDASRMAANDPSRMAANDTSRMASNDTGTMASNDSMYRQHWQDNFGSSGLDYESYEPAYRYGADLRSNQRFRDREWSDVENDVREDWSNRYPESAWEKFKDSIRFGWDSMTGKHRGHRSAA